MDPVITDCQQAKEAYVPPEESIEVEFFMINYLLSCLLHLCTSYIDLRTFWPLLEIGEMLWEEYNVLAGPCVCKISSGGSQRNKQWWKKIKITPPEGTFETSEDKSGR